MTYVVYWTMKDSFRTLETRFKTRAEAEEHERQVKKEGAMYVKIEEENGDDA